MANRERTVQIPPRGLGSSFTESETPPEYALKFRNRFINAAGGAEKRQGLAQFGASTPGSATLTGIHELIRPDSTAILMVSGSGAIYKFDTATSTWSTALSGLNNSAASMIQSVQMDGKLIFVNGSDRNRYTEDGTIFKELKPLMEQGQIASTSASSTSLIDSDISNWLTLTRVTTNDVVSNTTKGGKGLVTAVASGAVTHTRIDASALGIGVIGGTAQQSGDYYEIHDCVEMNVIQTDIEPDNVATAITGTTPGVIKVSASAVGDWTTTEIRIGDYISNTTRNALTEVTSISTSSLGVFGITGQTAGDSLVFLKLAMPIAKRAHVHFNRLYMIDSRDNRKIRISGPNNPQDMTVDAGTLDATTFKFGDLQPEADAAVSMGTFQRFFVIAGQKNLYLFQGSNPIVDVSADSAPLGQATAADFAIIGVFPQGAAAANGLASVGNDMLFVTTDGVQSISLAADSSTLNRANISEAVKDDIRTAVAATAASEVYSVHYPRRSWFLFKVGNEIFVFNYTPYFGQNPLSAGAFGGGAAPSPTAGAWHYFDGTMAQQKAFFVRRDGTLVACGADGKVYRYDRDVYADAGSNFTTELQTAWLNTFEPKNTVRIKQGSYIKPVFEVNSTATYTIGVTAGYEGESGESVTHVVAFASGSATIMNQKIPLRWRGEQVRVTFTTNDDKGPETISRFTLYMSDWGKK